MWQLEAEITGDDLPEGLEPLALSVFGTSLQALFASRREAEEARRMIAPRAGIVTRLERKDWLADNRGSFTPLRIGPFVVLPGGHPAPADLLPVRMEAGAGFGTGEHASTRGCLESLAALEAAPRSVVDMGCGSAILSIAAARLWDCGVLAVDNDPLAVAFARRQIRANGLAARIRLVQGEGFGAVRPDIHDLVVANILCRPLVAMAPRVTAETVILSGFLETDARHVLEAYRLRGFGLHRTLAIDGWTTLTLVRPRVSP